MISDFSFSVSVLNSVEPVLLACKYKATVKTMNNQQMKNWILKRQFRIFCLWRLDLFLQILDWMEACFILHTVNKQSNKHSKIMPAIYSIVCINNRSRSMTNVKSNKENERQGLNISIRQKVNKKAMNEMIMAWVKSNQNSLLPLLPFTLRMPNSCERFR